MNILKIKRFDKSIYINLDLVKNIILKAGVTYFNIDGIDYDDAEARKVLESYLSNSTENTKVLLQG